MSVLESQFHALGRWFRLKQYRLEVTFGVYMYTPIEKFVFWSVLFLLFSLTFIATVLYLPQHIVFIFSRAWFYAHGDEKGVEHVLGVLGKNVGAATLPQQPATETFTPASKPGLDTLAREL